jgi:1-deoxy-D-xylulose-5-phosphate synthase
MAVRYPRGSGEGVSIDPDLQQLFLGKGEILRDGQDLAILAIGSTVYPTLAAAKQLAEEGIQCAVANARFAKPLDAELVLELATRTKKLLTVEENALAGGFGSAVLELLVNSKLAGVRVECLGLPDKFIEHGTQGLLRSMFDLDADGIVRRVKNLFPELAVGASARQREEISR